MSKLLRADFTRLRKAKAFWICVALMAAYALILAFCLYKSIKRSGGSATFDQYFFSATAMAGYLPIPGLLMAALCSVFIGTDFSDGTIRNKLIAGNVRSEIYISHFITAAFAGICLLAAYWLPAALVGIPLFGTFQATGVALAPLLLGAVLAMVAYAAIYTMLVLIIQNKTATAILSLIGVIVVLFTVLFLISRMQEPEFIQELWHSTGQATEGSGSAVCVPNPNYMPPVPRMVAQFVIDLLPTGQCVQIGGMNAQHPWRLPVYALGIILCTGFCGMYVFRKKDLK